MPLTRKLLINFDPEAVCYSETMSSTDKAARLYGLEYHNLSTVAYLHLVYLSKILLPSSHRHSVIVG